MKPSVQPYIQSESPHSICRSLICELPQRIGQTVRLKGWVYRLRVHAKTTFVVLMDCTGVIQCVMATHLNPPNNPDRDDRNPRLDDCVEIIGTVRSERRSSHGIEIEISSLVILNRSRTPLPFNSSSSDVERVSTELQLENRPLVLRNERRGEIFRVQARVVELFRHYLTKNHFTEIFTSKLVSSGTEGGTNLFKLRYFEKTAYLAQSPQFFKEQCVAGLERVFETGHVYRAEPHATSRHLTEYYSLDVEMGYIDGPENVIELERALLNFMFEELNREKGDILKHFSGGLLPAMDAVPVWEFGECLDRLKHRFGNHGLNEDLDGEAERRLCQLASEECGVPAVFVLGFPLRSRPFYTAPRGDAKTGASQGFDLLFRGLEITSGGQRLHRRDDLEAALRAKHMNPTDFESHLRIFELGMPPHGGFAIGAERLTCQILGLNNIREATLYPRDRNRLTP